MMIINNEDIWLRLFPLFLNIDWFKVADLGLTITFVGIGVVIWLIIGGGGVDPNDDDNYRRDRKGRKIIEKREAKCELPDQRSIYRQIWDWTRAVVNFSIVTSLTGLEVIILIIIYPFNYNTETPDGWGGLPEAIIRYFPWDSFF